MNLWNDPDRWVDSDMQRDEWLLWLKWKCIGALVLATTITAAFVAGGVLMGR